jgi:hypothetical protein
MSGYRLDELRIGAPLGEGGAAEIHRCETSDGKPMVLKHYTEEALDELDVDALRHLMDWPAQLPVNDRERLMRICAWPQAPVIDGGAVIGVLMGEAPTKFFYRRNDKLVPSHFTYAAVTKERAERKNWPYYDFPHKIARFGHLLEELQFLHGYKIVVGDLQANNILTTSPEPDATGQVTIENFLLDCDSFIVDGRSALPPMDPQTMRPPYEVDGHSATTDLYKLAKLMIRCLSEDLGADAIHSDKFSNVLPSRDFEKLQKLLTLPEPGLTADDLGNLARAWQATVRPDGRLFCRTNRSLREPWTEEKRAAHLAGLEVAVTPSREVGKGAPDIHQQFPQRASETFGGQGRVEAGPGMMTCPNGHANPERYRYCGECGTSLVATVLVPPATKTLLRVGATAHGHAAPTPNPPASASPDTADVSAGPSRRAVIAISALTPLVIIAIVTTLGIVSSQSNSNISSNPDTAQPNPSTFVTATQETTTDSASGLNTPTAVSPPSSPPQVSLLPGTDALGFLAYPAARCEPGNPAAAMGMTSKSALVICRSGPATFYYRGVRFSDNASIELANAVRSLSGFDVTNPSDGTRYQVRPTGLTITSPEGQTDIEPMVEYASS